MPEWRFPAAEHHTLLPSGALRFPGGR